MGEDTLSFQLSLKEGDFLVKLARKAVNEYLETGIRVEIPESTPGKLLQLCGVFVTINKIGKEKKELRGCIGHPYPDMSLTQAVIESAIASATEDPRFPSISVNELSDVVFEISVLTPPCEIIVEKPSGFSSRIRVGEDGLIVERGVFKGLLLPQVPVKWKWDGEEFLCQCCIKAGLPPDCWLLEGTKIFKFQAVIFEEEKPRGNTKRKTIDGK